MVVRAGQQVRISVFALFAVASVAALDDAAMAVALTEYVAHAPIAAWSAPSTTSCHCNGRVSDLPSQIHHMQMILKQWHLKMQRAEKYHAIELINHQTKDQKDQRQAHSENSTRAEEYYKHTMCAKVTAAYVTGDSEAEFELNEICMGHKELALATQKEEEEDGAGQDPGCACALQVDKASSKSKRFRGSHTTNNPGEKLSSQLQQLNSEISAVKDEYNQRKADWSVGQEESSKTKKLSMAEGEK